MTSNPVTITINILNILMLLGVAQGLIFSLVIVLQKRLRSFMTMYLAFLTFSVSLASLQPQLVEIQVVASYPIILKFYLPWGWAIFPSLFAFLVIYLNRKDLKRYIVLLFAPFVVFSAFKIIRVLLGFDGTHPFQWWNAVSLEFAYVLQRLAAIFNLCLILWMYKIVSQYQKTKYVSKTMLINNVTWIKTLLLFSIIINIVWIVSGLLNQLIKPNHNYWYYPLWFAISLVLYWIAYQGTMKASILKERIAIRIKKENEIVIRQKEDIKLEGLAKDFYELVEVKKKFLDENFTLIQAAAMLEVSPNYLSQIISANFNKGFNQLINEKRVSFAKLLLNHPKFHSYKIITIGLESGFGSKSSFYSAFKKVTNKTPSEYRKTG